MRAARLEVTSLVMMSAWCGYYLAALKTHAPTVSWSLLHAVLGVGLVAGGTAAEGRGSNAGHSHGHVARTHVALEW